MNIIGLDPGAKGGIAVIDFNHLAVRVYKFDNLTEQEIYHILAGEACDRCTAFLEQVHGFPGQAGQFAFGQSYGFLRGVLVALGIPFEDVTPHTWQRGVGMSGLKGEKTDRKNALKQKAQQLFPQAKINLSVSDAVLIAEHGYRLTHRK